ncbi:hypothetical protein M422DRAFT_66706 [Sphaerobolus stellatus SS14]|uniref:Uncharacterized protein n=1 Tax=Sphaerobolus stellatus (strain SS14) TaxID=990650 RepID=A0A0C9W4T9_SPHS4|nr:hypothetical protein M422DRAFT_66706 [Sphaerobolus stellatus SS14]
MDAIPQLPPLEEYSLSGIWISTIIYGINLVLYFSCMYILIKRHSDSNGQWVLIATCTVLFITSTMHIGASFRQLLDVFIAIPKLGIPMAQTLYWLNLDTPVNTIKSYCYLVADIIQDWVLIWRLYVIFQHNWIITAIPAVLEITHMAIGTFGVIHTQTSGALQDTPQIRATSITAWAVVMAVNVGTTCAIAVRLFYLGRRHPDTVSWSSGGSASNKYLAPIFTIVESGAIFTASTIVLVALYAQNNPRLQTAVNVTTQLAATTPYLIIFRVGFGLTHAFGKLKKSTTTNTTNHSFRFGWSAPDKQATAIVNSPSRDAFSKGSRSTVVAGSNLPVTFDDYQLEDIHRKPSQLSLEGESA